MKQIVVVLLILSCVLSAEAKKGSLSKEATKINSCLNSLILNNDENLTVGENEHLIFKSDLGGLGLDTKAQAGFFHLSPSGVEFCELNFPSKTNFSFEFNGKSIVKNHSAAGAAYPQVMAGPTKCFPAEEAGNYAFSNRIYGHLYEEGKSSGQTKSQLATRFKKCTGLTRAHEKINDGIEARNHKNPSNDKDAPSTGNADHE